MSVTFSEIVEERINDLLFIAFKAGIHTTKTRPKITTKTETEKILAFDRWKESTRF